MSSSDVVNGSSLISGDIDWVEALNGDVPNGAIEGGYSDNKEKLYVARGYYKNMLLPGSLCPSAGCTYVTLEGKVAKLTAYEVLCNTKVIWTEVHVGNKNLPDDGIVGWSTDEGEMLCGRAKIKQSLVPGMYDYSKEVFYAVYLGKEMTFDNFEILVFVADSVEDQTGVTSNSNIASTDKQADLDSQKENLPHKWVEALNGDVPNGAIEGGYSDNKEKLYVARGYYKNILLPGSLCPSAGCIYVTLKGKVAKLTAYEVLCDTKVIWKETPVGNTKVPQHWLVGWNTDEGAMLCGRAKIKQSLVPGMYNSRKEVFYAVYLGKEMTFDNFEILVFDA